VHVHVRARARTRVVLVLVLVGTRLCSSGTPHSALVLRVAAQPPQTLPLPLPHYPFL